MRCDILISDKSELQPEQLTDLIFTLPLRFANARKIPAYYIPSIFP
jgi:hypothetical protein